MIDIVDPSAGVQDLLPAHGKFISNAVRKTCGLGQTETERTNDNKKMKEYRFLAKCNWGFLQNPDIRSKVAKTN